MEVDLTLLHVHPREDVFDVRWAIFILLKLTSHPTVFEQGMSPIKKIPRARKLNLLLTMPTDVVLAVRSFNTLLLQDLIGGHQ
jgi:hypothetical protein